MQKPEDKIYTEGPLLGAIWRLAWPAVVSMLLETSLHVIDAIWVGRLGADATASVTSSLFTIWAVYSLILIIPTGTLAIISRAVGANKPDEVSRTARQSIIMSAVVGAILAVTGIILTPYIFDFMDTSPIVSTQGSVYLRIMLSGMVFFMINDTIAAVFRAVGDTRAQMITTSIVVVTNIILDPLFIYGPGPFPRLETAGAAVATVISVFIGTIIYSTLIYRGRLKYPLNLTKYRKPDMMLLKTVVRIGSPPAVSMMIFSLVYIILNKYASAFGTESNASFIMNRYESISYLICLGFSMAAATMVGQNLGAGRPMRAARAAWVSLGIGVIITNTIACGFWFFPNQLAAVFTNDPAVVKISVNYLKILALSQMFMASEIILEGAFSGAGNTLPPMAISLPGSFARIPLAYYLCFHTDLGITGMWWTLTITTWARGGMMALWFLLGRWKKTGTIDTG